jgi:hypothetical protein
VSDFLDVKRREIGDRLKELAPLVEEYQRLEAASAALDSAVGTARTTTAAAPAAARPRRGRPARRASATTTAATTAAPASAATPRRRPGRRRGSGTRAAQALKLVQGQPGITIPELAAKMAIKQNYLYRVLPGLEEEGKVRKDGRGWHAAAAA